MDLWSDAVSSNLPCQVTSLGRTGTQSSGWAGLIEAAWSAEVFIPYRTGRRRIVDLFQDNVTAEVFHGAGFNRGVVKSGGVGGRGGTK